MLSGRYLLPFAVVVGLGFIQAIPEQREVASDVGDKASAWKDLAGTDDKRHSLDALSDKVVIVVCFTCNSCPYAVDYEDRLIAFQKKYADSEPSVQLVAINSNTIPADSLQNMKQRARDKGFDFPYLSDESQELARAFGAIYTPEFFVLNKDRTIIYKGAMDDSTKPENVQVKYVELAVDAALAGKSPEVAKAGARGCTIRFKRKRR